MSLVPTDEAVHGPDIMYALVLDNGKRWGEVAADFQVEDVEAIFGSTWPNKHFLTRPRGGSKTSDIAGLALSWLYADSPPRARGFVVASNADQAAILIDAAAGFVARTPVLADRITVENERIVNLENGAWVRVQKNSDSGSWGLLGAKLLICDEFAQWPETRGARRVWDAIRSTVQKQPDCRLIVLTSAGEPSHWSFESVFKPARDRGDELGWRVHEVPGPVPWQPPQEIAALREEFASRPSVYERLILNRWTSAEDRAISEEDYEAAAQSAYRWGDAPAGLRGGGWRFRDAAPGLRYLITVDIGLSQDATVLCVAHREPLTDDRRGPQRVVVDHIDRWLGSKKRHVQIEDVRQRAVELSRQYNAAPLRADPYQFRDALQGFRKLGVRAEAFEFTQGSVAQIATALIQGFHNRQVWVPDTPELRDELLRVKLRETVATMPRLDHEKGAHDDQAVCIGMAVHVLLGAAGLTSARQFMEMVAAGRTADQRTRARERRAERDERRGITRDVASGRPTPSRSRRERTLARALAGRPRYDADADDVTCPHGLTSRCLRCASRRPV